MRTAIGIVMCAVLFALYGLVRGHGCAGHCEGCSLSCKRFEGHQPND
jgi:hypothetical protein